MIIFIDAKTNEERLENKREKGKIRSKRSRDRKKRYLEELELKVKTLEKENLRLTTVIDTYKQQSLNSMSHEHQNFHKTFAKIRTKLVDLFFNKETGTYNDKVDIKLGDFFSKNTSGLWETQLKLFEKSFETIIDSAIPPHLRTHMDNVDKPMNWKYDDINKLRVMQKFQKEEFVKQNNINPLEVALSDLEVTEDQFDFCKDKVFKRESEVKQRFIEGMKHLLKARNIIVKARFDQIMINGTLLKSGIFEDSQIINSQARQLLSNTVKTSIQSIFDIRKKKTHLRPFILAQDLPEEVLERMIESIENPIVYEFENYYIGDEEPDEEWQPIFI